MTRVCLHRSIDRFDEEVERDFVLTRKEQRGRKSGDFFQKENGRVEVVVVLEPAGRAGEVPADGEGVDVVGRGWSRAGGGVGGGRYLRQAERGGASCQREKELT